MSTSMIQLRPSDQALKLVFAAPGIGGALCPLAAVLAPVVLGLVVCAPQGDPPNRLRLAPTDSALNTTDALPASATAAVWGISGGWNANYPGSSSV